ncbi:MAG: hypothetical protein CSA62_01810 [Planctomycetota bacterium]|nr:MAG: hypothetical protein CSA62_01810 [Planctomycetota bacterium]
MIGAQRTQVTFSPRLAGHWLPLAMGLLLCSCAVWEAPPSNTDLRQILDFEEQRSLADPEALATLLRSPVTKLRASTARALGRIRAPWSVRELGQAIGDPSPRVRAAAAYGLGQIQVKDLVPAAITALLTRLGDPDPEVRARVFEALGKIGDPLVYGDLMRALDDPAPEVRQLVALALHRQQVRAAKSKEPWAASRQEDVAQALVKAWKRERGTVGAWRYIYALAGLRLPSQVSELDRVFEPGSSEEARLFAIRGIAELVRKGDAKLTAEQLDGMRKRLLWLLKDPAPRLRIEAALALGDPSRGGRGAAERGTPAPFASEESLEALASALDDPNPQVARAAALGLGHFHPFESPARQVLQIAETSKSRVLQSAAIEAQARLLGSYYASPLAYHAGAPELHRAEAAARGLRFLSTREAVPILQTLWSRKETRARIAALSALKEHREDRKTLDIALEGLSARELEVRVAAAQAIGELGDASCLPLLRTVLSGSQGEDAIELRQELLTAITRIAPDSTQTRERLRASMKDPSHAVRRVAHRLLREHAGSDPVPALERLPELRKLPLPEGAAYTQYLASRPQLTLETTQGKIRLELWPDIAPVHVWNLLALCKDGGYDGRLWHRVVPNFVVQGGSSIGAASRSSFGFRLRDELGPKPFLTGVLGMPRSPEPDTGSEQIFLTTVPTPHLDGRYTAFGQVIEGLPVLFRLSVGDRIKSVSIQR